MARAGGIATRNRYGSQFYREIRKLRRTYWKGYMTKKTKERLRQWAMREAKAEKEPGSCCDLASAGYGLGGVELRPDTKMGLAGMNRKLLQLRVLCFGFLQDGDVGVGVFPEGEEILIGGFRFGVVTREHTRAG